MPRFEELLRVLFYLTVARGSSNFTSNGKNYYDTGFKAQHGGATIMSVQILGLRKFFSKEKQKEIAYDAFFSEGWRAPTVADLFAHLDKYLAAIPAKEQWNLYYTAAVCGEKKREFAHQEILPFDIDGIDVERLEDYIAPVLGTLGVPRDATGIVFSGNGLQLIVGLAQPFTDPGFFESHREHYKAVCHKIDQQLRASGLPGSADPSVFSPARILRLPGTLNRKPGKPERVARLLQAKIGPSDFDLVTRSGIPSVSPGDHISPEVLKRYPKPDSAAVLSGCAFLNRCKEQPADVSEAQWYAMLSVTARLENGVQLSHEYSEGHPAYTHSETEAKIEQALKASGPRTCKNIAALWDGCRTCPNFEKVNSPISIRGPDYIRTQSTGFHDIVQGKGGQLLYKPNYDDLLSFFERSHQHVVHAGICYTWQGTHYEEMPHAFIESFAQEHFEPSAMTHMTKEFLNRVLRSNLRTSEWFEQTTHRKMNFLNGVLNFDTMEFGPHSPSLGFRHVLPYEYDPKAQAPVFVKFLQDVTGQSEELQMILLEFMGYAFSNDRYWLARCLILTGEGRNGKSTFINIMKELAGGDSQVGNLTLGDIKNEVARASLDGKLFNMAEETPVYANIENSVFKNLIGGGSVMVKRLYQQPYSIKNRCKFIFACNELPRSKDTTRAYFRRLLIVPFNQVFEGANEDRHIESKLLVERSGIFNLIVQGYQRLKKQGEFTSSKVVDIEIEKHRLEVDTVAQWVRDCVETFPLPATEYVTADGLYAAYRTFTEERGYQAIEFIPFTRALTRQIDRYNERHMRKLLDGRKVAVLFGVQYSNSMPF